MTSSVTMADVLSAFAEEHARGAAARRMFYAGQPHMAAAAGERAAQRVREKLKQVK